MPASYLSPKTRIARSPIHGRGLFAAKTMRKGEIVAIKGGHVLDRPTLQRVRRRIAESYLQIDDDFYMGAVTGRDVRRNKLFINHSCEPTVGLRGQITFVALRGIKAGEELTYDWAMEENAPADWAMEENSPVMTPCRCGARRCRKILTGRDWRIPRL